MHSLIASVLILYSLIVYPVIGYFEGHTYPQSPTFGLPCPTTIFTFGMLLLSTNKPPLYIFIIPLVWSVIGSTAALALDVPGDLGLFVSGFLALAATVFSRRSSLQSIEQPQL